MFKVVYSFQSSANTKSTELQVNVLLTTFGRVPRMYLHGNVPGVNIVLQFSLQFPLNKNK